MLEVGIINNKSVNKFFTNNTKKAIEKMKYEIASEFGINQDIICKSNSIIGNKNIKKLFPIGEQLEHRSK